MLIETRGELFPGDSMPIWSIQAFRSRFSSSSLALAFCRAGLHVHRYMTLPLTLQQAGIHQASWMKAVFKKAGRGLCHGKNDQVFSSLIWSYLDTWLPFITYADAKKGIIKPTCLLKCLCVLSCHGLVLGQNNTCTQFHCF